MITNGSRELKELHFHSGLGFTTKMITSNVYHRVFFIRAAQYGTAFTLDVDGRQYLVSAKHVIQGEDGMPPVTFFHDGTWKPLPVNLVGAAPGEIDVVVLASEIRLSPPLPLEPSIEGIIFGQDVFFVGFPYKMWTNAGSALAGRPCPFIKKGTLSSTFDRGDGISRLFVDATNNAGFSGGPLVYSRPNQFDYRVAGVVSGFKIEYEPVIDQDGEETGLQVAYNTGFLLAYHIGYAVDLIRRNPIGFKLD